MKSLVEAAVRAQLEERYGPMPRAEEFALNRDGGVIQVKGEGVGRTIFAPFKMTEARRRYYDRRKSKVTR